MADGGSILRLGYLLAAHALARVLDPREYILRREVAGAHDTNANGERRAVPVEPAPSRAEHDYVPGMVLVGGTLFAWAKAARSRVPSVEGRSRSRKNEGERIGRAWRGIIRMMQGQRALGTHGS